MAGTGADDNGGEAGEVGEEAGNRGVWRVDVDCVDFGFGDELDLGREVVGEGVVGVYEEDFGDHGRGWWWVYGGGVAVGGC